MEDLIVKPGLYAYQFRVDIPTATGLTKVLEFIKKYQCTHYIIGAETSDLGKEHFQCVLWFKEKVNQSKLRNWWSGKTSETKQPVSLTTARKIKNLAKYTMKELNFITNLSEDELKLIGRWAPKVKAAEWSKLLDKHALKFKAMWCEEFNSHTEEPPVVQFMCHMLELYRENNRRPNRATLQYVAWKHRYVTDQCLISQWF